MFSYASEFYLLFKHIPHLQLPQHHFSHHHFPLKKFIQFFYNLLIEYGQEWFNDFRLECTFSQEGLP